ncbi:hypothetical protein J3A83DRAFT_4266301 [Scleroderma citrinum]
MSWNPHLCQSRLGCTRAVSFQHRCSVSQQMIFIHSPRVQTRLRSIFDTMGFIVGNNAVLVLLLCFWSGSYILPIVNSEIGVVQSAEQTILAPRKCSLAVLLSELPIFIYVICRCLVCMTCWKEDPIRVTRCSGALITSTISEAQLWR